MKTGHKKYIAVIIILILLLIIAFSWVLLLWSAGQQDVVTAVIEEVPKASLTDNSSGQVRIKINPLITVKNETMQNLNFCNYNEERLLQCRIKVEDKYIYESPLLEAGSVLKGDFIDTSVLKPGWNKAVAEVSSFTEDGEPIGKTNVVMELNLL